MTIDRVVATLHSAAPDLSAAEIAESLWLARFLPGRVANSVEPASRAGRVPTSEPSQETPAAGEPLTQPSGGSRTRDIWKNDRVGAIAGLYLAAPSAGPFTGIHTRAPAVPALPHALELLRAMRPLRWQTSSVSEHELDEEATAHAIAVAGRLILKYRKSPARWLDLALVVDDSPSMVVWRRTTAELRTIFERLGAFRSVRAWSIDAGPTGASRPLLRAGMPQLGAEFADRAIRSPRELLTPSGRRILIVVSDCVGPAWRSGALCAWLEQWGRSMPTALVQPLPMRLWDRCALDIARVRMRADRPGAPNRDLHVALREPQMHSRGTPVPILEAEPRWLGPWARMLAHTATGPVWGTATFTDWSPQGRLFDTGTSSSDDDGDPVQAVLRFRASVSPEAFQLARYLSAAPLNLPVMRLVQSVMLPRSRPRHLAEFFLSDLLLRRTPLVVGQDAEAVVYDFRKGTHEVLAATLRPDTGLHILAKVSQFISRRFGAALDFPAILAGAEVPPLLDDASLPFAEVAQGVLHALGGRYRTLARRLAHAMQGHDTDGVVSTADTAPPATHRQYVGTTQAGGNVTAPSVPSPQGADQGPAPPTVWGGVPPRNPNFTGRVDLLAQLREQLSSKVTALLPHALQGLGGVGKTQLAIEYVHRYAGEYALVWWIPSEQAALIRQSLVQLAPKLGILPSVGEDINQTLVAINDALRIGQPYGRWLLVFDNADRAEDLASFLSNPGGQVLITSRNRNWTSIAQVIEVDVFERDESIDLLRHHLPQVSEMEANQLADRLGDLPLALEVAAAWQVATAMTVGEYLALLDQQGEVLMSEEKPPGYPRPVAEAWGMAFQQLTERAPAALQMLELCAFLGSEPISIRLLRTARLVANRLPQPLAGAVADEIPLRRTIRDIDRYGLAKTDPARPSIQLHRLVQAVLRDRMTQAERESYLECVHALLAAANPADPDDDDNWPRYAEMSPHIVPARLVEGASNEVRQAVLDQTRYRWVQGDYEGSRELAQLALDHWQRSLGQDGRYTLDAGRLLAIALRSLGQVAEARQLNASLYERAKVALGQEHEHTLSIGNSWGADLRLLGHWGEALQLDEQLFALHRQVYGLDDRNTFRAANNLAVDYRLLGRFRVALQVDQDNERRLEAVLGQEHPDLLRTRSNLSRDHYGLGSYSRALEIQRQTLPVHRRVLGDDHAEVLKATRIHVATLRKTGSQNEAYELARELVTHSLRRLGARHPDTVSSKMTLSNCLAAIGEYTQARIEGEDAVAGFRDLLGAEHPFTLAATTNVAMVLRLLLEHQLARALDEKAVAGFQHSLGAEHHYTYCAVMNLANDFAVSGDFGQSRELTEQALDGLTSSFGDIHPQVLACRHNLRIDLEKTGDFGRARALGQELQQQFREVFGHIHPETQLMERRRRSSIEIEPPNW